MNNFFKINSFEDILVYTVMGLILIGLVLFFIGYFWNVDVDLALQSINVRKALKNPDTYPAITTGLDTHNLFTMMGSINKEVYGALYSMTALSVSGFAIIMIGFSGIFIILFGTMFNEFVLPIFKKVFSKK